ncbi:hypothetical protein PVAP13_3KG417500 [Panicum virgatum]|uniref:Uncharacterized protein n=1 Tax=Panicum virgatum TaxID=38727 RepID=A0A8T0V338_PANVG|nr:hypothetical protein PVAP13_3KG417500 [Panicum virgatum]
MLDHHMAYFYFQDPLTGAINICKNPLTIIVEGPELYRKQTHFGRQGAPQTKDISIL